MKFFRVCGLALPAALLLVSRCGAAYAQTEGAAVVTATPAGAKPAGCPVRRSPLSPGETALAQHNLPKAESLLREEGKAAGVDGERAHNALIRALLREEKFDDATNDAAAWLAGAPGNSWATVSKYEVLWRRGDVADAYDQILATLKLDRCNPRALADFANFQNFSGLPATAKRFLDVAHRIDPIDDDIAGDWIQFQPRAVKVESLTTYLAHADFLTTDDRKSLERWKDHLASEPVKETCHLNGPVASTSIPYQAIRNGPVAPTFWGLDVAFNGKSRRLEIDTGAHGLLLTKSAAKALHLEIEDQGKIGGIGDDGAVTSHTSVVDHIKIGSLDFENCRVEILEKNPEGLADEDGLIGGDVFSDFVLTLDFPGRLLKLDPLPAVPGAAAQSASLETQTGSADEPLHDRYVDPSMKDWTRVFRSGHDIILPVQMNQGPLRLFIMDTGSSLNLVSYQFAKQVSHVSKGSAIELNGISGKVKQTYSTGPLNLSFAGLRQETQGLVGMDTSSLGREAGVEIAGFIGAPTLQQLTVRIDYRDNLVHFAYDPKRLRRCVAGVITVDCF